jgi:hypothetical protein
MMDDRIPQLERELRRVKRFAAGMTIVLGAVVLTAFQQADRTRFTEIDVERLNVIEKDGTLRLAIFNSERKPPIIFHGKEYPGLRGGQAIGMAGMNYFNEEGSEVGGYGWRGRTTEDGGHTAAAHITFDQYDQGETLLLSYTDRDGQRRAGLSVLDQPTVSMQPALDSMIIIPPHGGGQQHAPTKRQALHHSALRREGSEQERSRLARRSQGSAAAPDVSGFAGDGAGRVPG